jgi:Carboxypeptidase regulatory-like domain
LLQVQFVEKITERSDMRIEGILRCLLAAATSLLALTGSALSQAQHPPSALIGHVTSDREGAMEGVVVSAKKDGSTITVSVVSDGQGQYAFPASKLVGGRYRLAIRAAGYDLDRSATADVVPGVTTTADLKLRPTENLPDQLTNSEWIESVPGSAALIATPCSGSSSQTTQRTSFCRCSTEWLNITRVPGPNSRNDSSAMRVGLRCPRARRRDLPSIWPASI